MLFRRGGEETVAVAQPSHAWLAGQIARAWGNSEYGALTPYEDVCLGAEQQDIGWLIWEQAPTLNPKTGWPHSFRELDVDAHTKVWQRGTDMAMALGRYPALLVSLHGTFLYASFDYAAVSDAAAATVRGFLAGQAAVQRRLIEALRAETRYADVSTPEIIDRNRLLVRAADRLSIAICTGLQDPMVRTGVEGEGLVRDVPTARGLADLRISAVAGDPTQFTVDPWPFLTRSVRLTCEGILLPPGRFEDEAAMRTALRAAKGTVITAELHPV